MNLRQQKYKANRLKGMTQYNAARAAGYSENYSKQGSRIEKVVIDSIQNTLEQAGMTDKFMAEQLVKWASGKNGKIAMTALRLAADMKGQIKQKHEHSGIPETNINSPRTIIFQDLRDSDTDAGESTEGHRLKEAV